MWSSCLKTSDGRFIFGGYEGYLSFYPDQINDNPNPPALNITRVEVMDEQIPLPANNLELEHDQNDMSIEYVGIEYTSPDRIQYQYMLEPYDTDWVDAEDRRQVRYTSLEPGQYTFRLKAANSDGVWSSNEASLAFTISPPWWRTNWAYLGYGLLLIAGIVAADRLQRQRLIRKEREKARDRELAQAKEIEKAYTELKTTQQQLIQQKKMASLGQLTSGIAYEIKNPLNFVNNFAALSIDLVDEISTHLQEQHGQTPVSAQNEAGQIDSIEARQIQDYDQTNDSTREADEALKMLKMNVEKIHEHGRRADGIVQSMMRHASGGKGERQKVDLNAFVEEYVNLAFYSILRETRRVGENDAKETRRVYRENIAEQSVTNDTAGLRGKKISERSATKDTVSQRGLANTRGPQIKRDYDERIGDVEVVPQEIGQALINLLNNAIDAVSEKAGSDPEAYEPTIQIQTVSGINEVEIHVIDNGAGIPADIQERVFEPFFTTKPAGSGTGLGLSLSYDIVTQGHGGDLRLISDENATVFVMVLPIRP